MRNFHTLLVLALAASNCWGQLLDAPRMIQTTFELEGGLIFIKGETDETGYDNYLLDTGAPTLILNQAEQNPFSIAKVVSLNGCKSVGNKKVKDFKMQGINMGDIHSYTTDLSHLETIKKKSIKGILGYKVFRPFELFIDYEKRFLMLFEQGASDLHQLVKPKETVKFHQKGHFPIVKVKIGSKNYYFGIDTGAEVNVLDIRWQGRMKRKNSENWTEKRVQGIDQTLLTVQACRLPTVEVGQTTYENMDFVFADLAALSECTGFQLDGILGFPFLSSGKFSINYKKRRLYLWDDPLKEMVATELVSTVKDPEN